MDAASRYNKNDRKKRLSETRGSPFGFKPALLTKKSASTHNRSSSMNKDKKFRINTDYDRYEYPSAGGPTVPPRFTKKVHLGYQRRDTYDFENGHLGKNNLVQSTKNNPNKNLDLRLLFKNNFVVGPTG